MFLQKYFLCVQPNRFLFKLHSCLLFPILELYMFIYVCRTIKQRKKITVWKMITHLAHNGTHQQDTLLKNEWNKKNSIKILLHFNSNGTETAKANEKKGKEMKKKIIIFKQAHFLISLFPTHTEQFSNST